MKSAPCQQKFFYLRTFPPLWKKAAFSPKKRKLRGSTPVKTNRIVKPAYIQIIFIDKYSQIFGGYLKSPWLLDSQTGLFIQASV
jgi:hypothetical protein